MDQFDGAVPQFIPKEVGGKWIQKQNTYYNCFRKFILFYYVDLKTKLRFIKETT